MILLTLTALTALVISTCHKQNVFAVLPSSIYTVAHNRLLGIDFGLLYVVFPATYLTVGDLTGQDHQLYHFIDTVLGIVEPKLFFVPENKL